MLKLIAIETRQLSASRPAQAALLVLCLMLGIAMANGRSLLASQIATRAAATAEASEARAKLTEQVAKGLPADEAVLLPVRVRDGAVSAVPPLADVVAGRAATDPAAASISLRSRADTLFRRPSLENPERLARGSLDLAFVAIVVAPLLLIALGHGLFSGDRDSGAARLVLAQAGRLGPLLLARSLPRLALVAGPILLALALLLATGPDLPGRSAAALDWAGLALALLAAWWGAILWVNSRRVSADGAALTLVSLWALFTLVLPVLLAANVQLLHPAPSRLAEMAAVRAAEIAASTEWENDHPEVASNEAAARRASVARAAGVNARVEAAVAPVSARFVVALAAQQQASATLSWVVPPLLASQAMADASGTGLAGALAYRAAAAAQLGRFKAALGTIIAGDGIVTPKRLAALPQFQPPPPTRSALPATLWLALLAALFTGLAARNFARIELA
jgi:ABC-2 type transport system permease protein